MSEGVDEGAAFTCDHLYGSIHDPDLPLQWIRECMVCGGFDGDSMREEIGKFVASRGDIQEALALYDSREIRQYASDEKPAYIAGLARNLDTLVKAVRALIDLGCTKDEHCPLPGHVLEGRTAEWNKAPLHGQKIHNYKYHRR